MTRPKTPLRQIPPDLTYTVDAQLRRSDFDAAIEKMGYLVVHEKAYLCPCRDKENGNNPLSSCKNCGGTGWFFINPIKTKMVLQQMNSQTQYKEWSAENIGRAMITFRAEENLGYMDRVTLQNSHSVYNQILKPIFLEEDDLEKVFVFTFYNIKEVEAIFKFVSPSDKLSLIEEGAYSFQNNIIDFEPGVLLPSDTISIRYKHKIQYIVMDINRDIMSSPVKNSKGYVIETPFPRYAVAAREHYILDAENYAGTRILNNSFENCKLL